MARTTFRPETDGYAFLNNWTWRPDETVILRTYIHQGLMGLEAVLSPILLGIMSPIFTTEIATAAAAAALAASWSGFGAAAAAAITAAAVAATLDAQLKAANRAIVDAITNGVSAEPLGLCGGMTLSSLDYWLRNWIAPRGTGEDDRPGDPGENSPEGRALRSYIWERQINSMDDNVGTFVEWIAILHLSEFFAQWHGDAVLRQRSRDQLSVLREQIDAGRPVPLGLVGTSWNPGDSHQVLCYGYEQRDAWTWLFLYDNNHPGVECSIRVRFDRGVDWAVESHPHQARGPLRGFFCTRYLPSSPPRTVVLRNGLSFTPPGAVERGQEVHVHATAANVGYHVSPGFQLRAGEDIVEGRVVRDTTDENPRALEQGADRELNSPVTFDVPGTHRFTLRAFLGNFESIDVFKVLPSEGGVQSSIGSVVVFEQPSIVGAGPAVRECEPGGIVRSTFMAGVRTDGMGDNLTYHWSVAGAGATIDPVNAPTVTVHLPAQAGVEVTLSVQVTRPNGVSQASMTVTTITEEQANLERTLCQAEKLAQRMSLRRPERGLPRPDPGPQRVIVERGDLAQFRNAVDRLATASHALGDQRLTINRANDALLGLKAR